MGNKTKCIAPGCKRDGAGSHRYYRFPRKLKQKWTEILQTQYSLQHMDYPSYVKVPRICRRHFHHAAFEENGDQLKEGAEPTLFQFNSGAAPIPMVEDDLTDNPQYLDNKGIASMEHSNCEMRCNDSTTHHASGSAPMTIMVKDEPDESFGGISPKSLTHHESDSAPMALIVQDDPDESFGGTSPNSTPQVSGSAPTAMMVQDDPNKSVGGTTPNSMTHQTGGSAPMAMMVQVQDDPDDNPQPVTARNSLTHHAKSKSSWTRNTNVVKLQNKVKNLQRIIKRRDRKIKKLRDALQVLKKKKYVNADQKRGKPFREHR